VERLCSGLPRVRYIRLSQRTPTGTKLNIGIERMRGTVVQKLDDDDYYHPGFLELAVSRLPAGQRRQALVAWDCFLIFLTGESQLRHSGHGWAAGGTFCFHRELWDRTAFRDVWRDEDAWLLNDARPTVVPVCAPERYILVRHGENTWRRMEDGQAVEDYFQTLPVYDKSMKMLVGPSALRFYRSLA